jgi:hypothetical protein
MSDPVLAGAVETGIARDLRTKVISRNKERSKPA